MTRDKRARIDAGSTLLPKLRFPEFSGEPGWESKPLSHFVQSLDAGVSANSGDCPAGNEQLGVLKTSAVTSGNFEPNENKVVASSDEQARLAEPVTADTIIISRMNTPALVGANAYVATSIPNLFLPDRLWAAKPAPHASMRFLSFVVGSDRGRAALRQLATGTSGSMKNINKSDVLGLMISAPRPAEQRKIAECLSTLDDLIGAESQKLDALKARKKGLMQQLFPREGETLPRLRFPEFQGAPGWEQRMLRDAAASVFDGTHQTPTYVESGVPFYSVENLISGNANKFISREDYVAATRKNKPEKGDILLTRIGRVGHSSIVTWEHEFSVYVTLAVIKKSELFVPGFLHFFIQSDRYQAELHSKSLPNAMPPKINLDSLRATIVLLPQTEEQQRIASCLSALDELIAGQNRKLEALKTHKQGLLQQLFPTNEPVCA